MKTIVPFLFITLISSSLSADEQTDSKSTPSYTITKTGPDSNLKKTEALFVFSFYNGDDSKVSKNIKFSVNGTNFTTSPDASGKIYRELKPGKYKFQFWLDHGHMEIYTDSISIGGGIRTEMAVRFRSSTEFMICDKPVIYLYPEKKTEVNVKLEMEGNLLFTYPAYNAGWNVTADPTGALHVGDKQYNYLFWEGDAQLDSKQVNWNRGFVVQRDSLVPFFEINLSRMGLTSPEIADFITYWCPRMNANEWNYIHFMFNEEVNQFAKLNIAPAPDHLNRVYMVWSAKSEFVMKGMLDLIPQEIPVLDRTGFDVLEWGGSEMKGQSKNPNP